MIKILVLICLLLITTTVSSQTAPARTEESKDHLSAIRGKVKVHINADDGDWEAIANEIEGKYGLIVVDEPDEADFYISYVRTSIASDGGQPEGMLEVYVRAGEKLNRIWSTTTKDLKDRKASFPKQLARTFLIALKSEK